MVKRLIVLGLLFSIAGCQEAVKETSEPIETVEETPAAIEAVLPPEVTGVWKAEGETYTISITPDGKVSWAIIPLLELTLGPNQTVEVPMKDGSTSVIKSGDWVVNYNAEERELSVVVYLEEIHVRFMTIANDGDSTDIFIGRVSEDGKVWQTSWMREFDYGPDLPWDPNGAESPQVFNKVEE